MTTSSTVTTVEPPVPQAQLRDLLARVGRPCPDGVPPMAHLTALLTTGRAGQLLRTQQALYAAMDALRAARSSVEREVAEGLGNVRDLLDHSDFDLPCPKCAGTPPTDFACSGCGEIGEHRIDGDLLADVIADACPEWMTAAAAGQLAERVLTELAATTGVTVVRGPDGAPSPPTNPMGGGGDA